METTSCMICGTEIPKSRRRKTCSAECRQKSYVQCSTDEIRMKTLSKGELEIARMFRLMSSSPDKATEDMFSEHIKSECRKIRQKWTESEHLIRAGIATDPISYDSLVGRHRHNGQVMERSE